MTHLHAGRQHVVIAGRRASLSDRLINQILKIRPHFFETGGVHVRQVVSDDVDIRLLRHHPRTRCP